MGKLHASPLLGLTSLALAGWFSSAWCAFAATTIVDEDFAAGSGSFSVQNFGAVEEPWAYNASGTAWAVNGSVDLGVESASALDSPAYVLTRSGEITLQVHHRYNFEIWNGKSYDGGQIRVSVNGGPYQAVSSFSQNGYDSIMAGVNVLNGQPVFGKSAGYDAATFDVSIASLGTFNAGDSVSVRFLGAWDDLVRAGTPNWEIDRLVLVNQSAEPVAVAESVTDVFMASATILTGNGGTGSRINYFSLQVRPPAVHAGIVSSRSENTVVDDNATWSDDAFNGANGTHYILFENGVTADVADTLAAAHSLVVPGTLDASVIAGTAYQVHPHTTLADIFGPNNESGLMPGRNASESDNVLIHAADTQETMAFFFSSVPGYTGWYRDDFSPADDTIVYPEQGLMVRRRSVGDLVVLSCGQIRSRPVTVPVYAGFNLLGTLLPDQGTTLDALNLVTGDPMTGFAAGSNLAESDNLVVLNPDSTTATYFYSNYPGFEGWYNASFTPASQVVIPAGSAFFIQRKLPRGLFEWSIPVN